MIPRFKQKYDFQVLFFKPESRDRLTDLEGIASEQIVKVTLPKLNLTGHLERDVMVCLTILDDVDSKAKLAILNHHDMIFDMSVITLNNSEVLEEYELSGCTMQSLGQEPYAYAPRHTEDSLTSAFILEIHLTRINYHVFEEPKKLSELINDE
jgi:hypothetical protein